MDDEVFEAIRAQIDKDLELDSYGRSGIAMSFGLAGEFMRRDLLKITTFKMIVQWETRTYCDRHVYPDPQMDDYGYRIGQP